MTTIPEESHNETTPFTEEQCHFLERAIATVVANTTVHPQCEVRNTDARSFRNLSKHVHGGVCYI